MATTFTKIADVSVGAGGASTIDFTSIPATFTDIVVLYSLRSNYASSEDAVFLRLGNGSIDTGSNYTYRFLRGAGGGTPNSGTGSGVSFIYSGQIPAVPTTASTFANGAAYIPNYAGSAQKSVSIDCVGENNGSTAYALLTAGLWTGTSAITNVRLYPENGTAFVQYSTATLYGISKS